MINNWSHRLNSQQLVNSGSTAALSDKKGTSHTSPNCSKIRLILSIRSSTSSLQCVLYSLAVVDWVVQQLTLLRRVAAPYYQHHMWWCWYQDATTPRNKVWLVRNFLSTQLPSINDSTVCNWLDMNMHWIDLSDTGSLVAAWNMWYFLWTNIFRACLNLAERLWVLSVNLFTL